MPTQPEAISNSLDDIQTQVLQTTLAEIETTRQAAHPDQDLDLDVDGQDCCVICLDTVSEPCSALPCAHSNFDFLCLLSWLQQRASCPLCKCVVAKVRYISESTGAESFYAVPPNPSSDTTATTTATSNPEPPQGGGGGHIRNHPRRRRPPPVNYRPPPSSSNQALTRRRQIYQQNLYSLHVGTNPRSSHRPCPTPLQLSSTPHLISRARLWIRRELQVFSFLSAAEGEEPKTARRANNAEFLLEYMVAILKTVDIQGSLGQASEMLADFLGKEHALLFLHELRNWLRSPAVGLAEWDREVQYPDARALKRGKIREEGEDAEKKEERGVSWQDETGDHWRPSGPGGPVEDTGGDDAMRKKRRTVRKERSRDRGRRVG